ncbi:calcium-binding protein [Kordiimonas sediminis]|uniref:Calcium-binding protein n=1 Tax=Kordiimonas sediminis TaxID=1735581 RepID=A0A919ALF0_9PROT|nr:Tim44/TimA family putative adaptor protein [Kordiimonas sediminis]GHF15269.1 calcium-binding protein [Kordiimonas sediminis]
MEFFDIILIGMIAAFVLLRLRSELGNKTGNEPMPPAAPPHGMDNRRQGPAASQADTRQDAATVVAFEANPAVRQGLSEIQRADSRFNPAQFLEGAQGAYRMILEAFWQGDLETLKDFLSDDVYAQFAGAVDAREAAEQTLDNRLLDIEKAEITTAELNGRDAELTVTFNSEIIAVTRDKDGNAVEGNLSDTITVTDVWTFARSVKSRDPNWILVATRSG